MTLTNILLIIIAITLAIAATALRRISFLLMNHLGGGEASGVAPAVAVGVVAGSGPDEPHVLRLQNTSNAVIYNVALGAEEAFRTRLPGGAERAFSRGDLLIPGDLIAALLPGQIFDIPIGVVLPPAEDAGGGAFIAEIRIDYLRRPNALEGNPSRALLGTAHLESTQS